MILAYIDGVIYEGTGKRAKQNCHKCLTHYKELWKAGIRKKPPRAEDGFYYCSKCGKRIGKKKLQQHHYRGYLKENLDKTIWVDQDCHAKHHKWVVDMEIRRRVSLSLLIIAFPDCLTV